MNPSDEMRALTCHCGRIACRHHPSIPAVEALASVMHVHRPSPVYEPAELCSDTNEDHQDNCHWGSEDGTLLCDDMPTGETVCYECRDDWGDPRNWPCATVRTINQATEVDGWAS